MYGYTDSIPIGSSLWWQCFIVFIAVTISILAVSAKFTPYWKNMLGKLCGYYLLFDILFLQYYIYCQGHWALNSSLPLYFCNIMALIAVIALVKHNQSCYEIALGWGIIGPLQAFITPAFAYSSEGWYFYSYFLSHGIIIIAPIYLTFTLGMRPRPFSWLKGSFFMIPLAPLILAINYYCQANYMFLTEAPPLAHPLIIGSWPFYIFFWIILGTFISFISHLPFHFLRDK